MAAPLTAALLFLLLGLVIAEQRISRGSGRRLPTQEEADCPRGCHCDRTNIVCHNGNFRGADIFQQLHAIAFPHVDTLYMTGNKFGDISGRIFGGNEVHEHITLLNLTDCGITKFDADTFRATPELEYLYLNDNSISSVGADPFKHVQNLRFLDLSKALANRSEESKADLLSLMFESPRRSHVNLAEINLSNNGLTTIHPETFCKIDGLARLILSNNLLTKFEVTKGCLRSLKNLDLSHNNFVTVPGKLWDALPSLNTFDISDNSLQCDCGLQPFLEASQADPNHFVNQERTVCDGPSHYSGAKVYDIKDNLCKSSSIVGQLILLTVVAGAAFFIYRHFRHRIPVPPIFQFGYQNLNTENQNFQENENVRPEFV